MKKRRPFYGEAGGGTQRIWYVDSLWEQSKDFEITKVEISKIDGVDQVTWFHEGGPQPTCREIASHCKRIINADLSFPVLLTKDYRVLDGMHRIAKCLMQDIETIDARIFEALPEPDQVNDWPPTDASR